MPLDRLPLTRNGQVGFQVENSLASIAAAWSLGIPLDVIRSRAESIAADIDKVPGRFNVLEIEGATVVVDYGHNAHSLAAVIEALGRLPAPAPHVRLLDRRRPPRLRHRSPGRTARRGLRPRHPLRGPLPPRPRARRDRGPVRARAWSRPRAPRRSSRSPAPRRRPKRRSAPPSPANWCSCRPTRSTRRCNGSAAIWRRWRPGPRPT